ncbi:MAG TPA: sulfatase [Thermoanaerobaculia bacterium]|jgi:arylsulfatase A-like enzyme|nr:sulfatase [Thermoanaerobaculia bacterium]
MKPTPRRLLVLAALLAPLLGAGLAPRGAAAPAPGPRPNIVLLVTDDQDLLLGSLDAMPHLRQLLIEKGTTFSQAYVPLSLCCPSRATILTGRYTHNLKVYQNFPPDGGFAAFQSEGHEASTVGVALRRVGYRTALMGKYLNGYPNPEDRTWVPPGWNEWFVPAGGNPYGQYNYTLNHNGKLIEKGREPEDYLTDVLARQASGFISQAAEDGVPFFLYLAPYAAHKPCPPAPRHASLFPDARAPRTASFNEADVRDKPGVIRGRGLLSPEQIRKLDGLYRRRLQSLQAVDEAIAALVDTLEETGQLANTYFFFTSDNGFHMGQHRLNDGKYTSYDEDVHVPLIVRGPHVPAGATADAFVESVDLSPTIAQLAGTHMRVSPDGRSFVPLLRTPRQPPAGWRQLVFLEQFHFDDSGEGDLEGILEPRDEPVDEEHVTHFGLRTATYKFVEYETGEREYYDLVNDPGELQNQASHQSAARLRTLSKRARDLGACRRGNCRALETNLP